ncbi:MAG TPA: glycosyl hydrolase family 18 protein [Candidatus Limnocylindrales bacterium]
MAGDRRTHRRTASLLAALTIAVVVAACGATPVVTPSPPIGAASGAIPQDGSSPAPTGPPPAPGHQVYGFVPYWEMDAGIADHLAATPLTTIGLFSVTHAGNGSLRTAAPGYAAITGDVGRRVISEAHARGTRVEVVYSSFGLARNAKLFGTVALQDKVIASLVQFVGEVGADGVNVDVEALDSLLVPAYAGFLTRLRVALVAAHPGDQVSVATQANMLGAAMAVGAIEANADRIFLMAYDYRTGGSAPGATSPIARRDGVDQDIPWSLDLYAALGVPPQKLLLGLPLYGVTWPVVGPDIGAPSTGRGAAWILRKHVDLLGNPAAIPVRDEIEAVEVYALGSDGSIGPPASGAPSASAEAVSIPPGLVALPSTAASPTSSASPTPAPASAAPSTPVTWNAVYVDSPATLAMKMGLALDRGLAGVGFWAIGYERGLPGYTDVMTRFADGAALP